LTGRVDYLHSPVALSARKRVSIAIGYVIFVWNGHRESSQKFPTVLSNESVLAIFVIKTDSFVRLA
jgi:hypothetical protein